MRTCLKFEWADKKHIHPKAEWRNFSLWTKRYISYEENMFAVWHYYQNELYINCITNGSRSYTIETRCKECIVAFPNLLCSMGEKGHFC